jgi:hypothetical protein
MPGGVLRILLAFSNASSVLCACKFEQFNGLAYICHSSSCKSSGKVPEHMFSPQFKIEGHPELGVCLVPVIRVARMFSMSQLSVKNFKFLFLPLGPGVVTL